nr:rhodanese-like domain-containing protein [Candidatus Njordarchaeota archaeon]
MRRSYQVVFILFLIASISVSTVSVGAVSYSTVSKDWVKENLRNPSVVLVDARSVAEYRSGHIPGAINIEWTYAYDYNGSYKPVDELNMLYGEAGVTPDKTVVTYCQAGVRAKALYDTLLMLGYTKVFVYAGSWAEWSADPKDPVETRCALALVSGVKNNTSSGTPGCACSLISESASRNYTFISELAGFDRLLAIGSALSNDDVRLLMANFTQSRFIPQPLEANATEVIYENNVGEFSKGTVVAIPCRPVTPENENVTFADIFYVSKPKALARAVSEETIDGKIWQTFYWVNQTTRQVHSVTVDPCDWLCLIGCAFADPLVWEACVEFCWCAWVWWFCTVPCVACIITLGAISFLCTCACGCWTSPAYQIKIEAWPTTDYYSRSHGMAIDRDLPDGWWTLSGYEFKVTGSAFTYETSATFSTTGSHYVEYAASGYAPDYAWHARIYINGVLQGEGDVGRYTHLRVYFTVSQ